MKEEFLAYVWKHRLISTYPLKTTCGEKLEVISPGQENHNSGPDFLAAVIRIGDTLWAGNVEIHVLSSHWFIHGHHTDKAYMNIILHVVYACDNKIPAQNGKKIPHLELKSCFDPTLINNYTSLAKSRSWIACEKLINKTDPFIFKHWLYRLLTIRLERKSQEIYNYLDYFGNHQEKTTLFLVSRSIGGKTNETAFGLLLQRIPFDVIIKNHDNTFVLEALLFGQAGMLSKRFDEDFPNDLQREHAYLKKKYALPPPVKFETWKYSRMRPFNFPDLRIAQLAMIINKSKGKLFRQMLDENHTEKIRELLSVSASDYWNTHYRLNKKARSINKNLGVTAVNNIIINTVAPMLFAHAKSTPGMFHTERAVHMLEELPPEDNKIIRNWTKIIKIADNAANTQGCLELYKYYCLPKKCLRCMVGHQIIKRPGH